MAISTLLSPPVASAPALSPSAPVPHTLFPIFYSRARSLSPPHHEQSEAPQPLPPLSARSPAPHQAATQLCSPRSHRIQRSRTGKNPTTSEAASPSLGARHLHRTVAMSVPGVASRAADRFYCPPPRRHLLDKQHQPLAAAAAAVEEPANPTPELRRDEPPPAATNLESFIASTAVRVPARRHPRVRPLPPGPSACSARRSCALVFDG